MTKFGKKILNPTEIVFTLQLNFNKLALIGWNIFFISYLQSFHLKTGLFDLNLGKNAKDMEGILIITIYIWW